MLTFGAATDNVEVGKISMLFYGKAGIGKTTLATTLPNAVIFNFNKEGYRRAQNKCNTITIDDWGDIESNWKHLDAEIAKYDYVVIDTIDSMMAYIQVYIKRENPKIARNMLKVYGMVGEAASDFFKRLIVSGKGLCFVAHEEEKNISGTEDTFSQPKILGKLAKDIIYNFIDLVGYMYIEGDKHDSKRMLTFERSEFYLTKNPLELEGLASIQIPPIDGNKQLNTEFLSEAVVNWQTMWSNKLNSVDKSKVIIDEFRAIIDEAKDEVALMKIAEKIKARTGLSKIILDQIRSLWNARLEAIKQAILSAIETPPQQEEQIPNNE